MAGQLKAGAGKSTIHFPDSLFPIEGFKGIHDEPNVRILTFDCGEKAALAAIEMVGVPNETITFARKFIAEKLGTSADNVWIHTTHAITTPHPPHVRPGEPMTEKVENDKKAYVAALEAAITDATEQAVSSMTDAKIGFGEGTCSVNINRDTETPFGWWIGLNPDGPSNKTATVVKVSDKAGKLIGILINYDLKPCAIDNSERQSNNRVVSSDVPGYACTALEEKYGCPVMFTMAAAGDQVTREQTMYETVDEGGKVLVVDNGVDVGLEIVERLGKEMTGEIAAVIDATACDRDSAPVRAAKTKFRWATQGHVRKSLTKTLDRVQDGEDDMETEVIAIGDAAFVGIKPEINTITASQLKKKSPFANTMVISMVNGNMHYMPDIKSYENVTWESQSTRFMPGVAEEWVITTANLLESMK